MAKWTERAARGTAGLTGAGVGAVLMLLVMLVVLVKLPLGAAPAAERHRCEQWVDVLAGEPTTYPHVLADLARARVIYLGERHGVERHHGWQARIVADLARQKVPLVLGLEQIEAFRQPVVDRFNRGEVDFAGLARELDWTHRWPSYEDYRAAVEAARQAGAPVLALNARQETIRQVARSGGVGKLDDKTRAELPQTLVLTDLVYEKLLGQQLGVHMAATPERLRPMVEAQMARDEAMAENLARFLQSDAGKGRTAVVLTGAGHVSYGLGMPARVRRRLPGVKERIVLFSESGDVDVTPEMEAVSREVHITHDDLRAIPHPIADYLQVAAPRGE